MKCAAVSPCCPTAPQHNATMPARRMGERAAGWAAPCYPAIWGAVGPGTKTCMHPGLLSQSSLAGPWHTASSSTSRPPGVHTHCCHSCHHAPATAGGRAGGTQCCRRPAIGRGACLASPHVTYPQQPHSSAPNPSTWPQQPACPCSSRHTALQGQHPAAVTRPATPGSSA